MKTSIYTITAFFILLATQLNGFDMPVTIDTKRVCLFLKPTGKIKTTTKRIEVECISGSGAIVKKVIEL